MLGSTEEPLEQVYDLVMLDLDGVVYVGPDAVPGAADHLSRSRDAGARCAFVTNNASRTPAAVAEHLRDLGVQADDTDVVSSAQAAARLLRDEHGEGARVVLVGGDGLRQALEEAGLSPVDVESVVADASSADTVDAAALVTGYGPDVTWHEIMLAGVVVRAGLPWVASNTDMTIPTAAGVAPGHGVLVDTLRRFTEVEPVVAGKPERPLLDETVARVGGERPLMVGDRLDTDIEGGIGADVDTLLVLTGVTDLATLVAAGPGSRPTYLAIDLGGLHEPQPAAESQDGRWRVGEASAEVVEGALRVEGEGSDWWRAAACAAWEHLDATGERAGLDGLEPPPAPRP